MVRTRRGAGTGSVDTQSVLDDPEASLRKKAGRKAAPSQSTTSETAIRQEGTGISEKRARATRSQITTKDVAQEELSQSTTNTLPDSSATSTRTLSKAIRDLTRGKTAKKGGDTSSKASALSTTREQAAKSASQEKEQEEARDVASSAIHGQPGPARRSTRQRDKIINTQQTATADEGQDPNTRSRPKAKTQPAKRRQKGARVGVKTTIEDGDREEVGIKISTPVKKPKASNTAAIPPFTPDSSRPTNSGTTTPALSPAHNFEQANNLTEDEYDAGLKLKDHDEDVFVHEVSSKILNSFAETSDDELAGPPTVSSKGVHEAKALMKRWEIFSTPERSNNVNELSHRDTEDSTMFQDVLSDEEDEGHGTAAANAEIKVDQPRTGHQPAVDDRKDDSFSGFDESETAGAADDSLMLDINPETLPTTLDDHILDLNEAVPAADTANTDLDATELIEVVQESHSPASSDRSVIHTQLEDLDDEEMLDVDEESADIEEDNADDYTRRSLPAKTPRSQTIHWENIQPNTAVRQNLALPISPQIDDSQLGIMPDQLSSPTKREIAAQVEQQIVGAEEASVEFTDFVAIPTNETLLETSTSVAHDSFSNVADSPDDVFGTGSIEPEVETETRDTPPIEDEVPHYMHSTIAFDARRKSMPNRASRTPIKAGQRPKTSDGAKDDAHKNTYDEPWWLKARSTLKVSPITASPRRNVAPFASSMRWHASTPMATPVKARTNHTNTVAVPSRHQRATPIRPVGALSARELLAKSTRNPARSPARTPLRTLMGMSSISSMTPHPTVPLRGVVAIVEVYTSEGASASAPFINILHRLGAKTTKLWGDRITHVVFKDGPPTILQRVVLHNKKVLDTGIGTHIHCINSRWVSDSDTHGARALETDESYVVNTGDHSINRRKRKSMEPSTVINVDGSLFKRRKNSWGRSLSGRLLGSPMASASPRVPSGESVGKENSASPATPAWLAVPDTLAQSTVPVKQVRKLDSSGLQKYKARRQSFWNDT